jgi:hypothetical protein
MKILIVGPYSSPIIRRLVNSLKSNGVEVFIASHNASNIDGVIDLGPLNSFFDYLKFFKINKIVNEINPDLVHAHIVNHYGLMCILQSKPLVTALWGSEIMLDPYGKGFKKYIFRLINWFVLKRSTRCHTSAMHIGAAADKQASSTLMKTDVFYWGLSLSKPTVENLQLIEAQMKAEFCLSEGRYIVFPRGLSQVYNPSEVVKILKFLSGVEGVETKDIVVLKGFSSEVDELVFRKETSELTYIYIDRLLNDDELYFLYSHSLLHFSIPTSDALGGGVIEPAVLGSFPVLSELPSYFDFAKTYGGYIYKSGSEECDKHLLEIIRHVDIEGFKSRIPLPFSDEIICSKIINTYNLSLGLLDEH